MTSGRLSVVAFANPHPSEGSEAVGADREAVFMECPHGPPELRENYGCTKQEVAALEDELAADIVGLCEAWRRIHGNP